MAERKVTNNTMLLFLGTAADDLDTVVCGTKIDRQLQASEIESGTFCGPDKSIGDVTGDVNFEGQHLLDPDSGKISGYNIFGLMVAKTPIFWKISPASPVSGDIVKTGAGYIKSLSDTYQYNTQSTFSFSIAITGTPAETETA